MTIERDAEQFLDLHRLRPDNASRTLIRRLLAEVVLAKAQNNIEARLAEAQADLQASHAALAKNTEAYEALRAQMVTLGVQPYMDKIAELKTRAEVAESALEVAGVDIAVVKP